MIEEVESLREQNAQLLQRALAAEQRVEALLRSEALFRAVIEKSSEVVSMTAADGTTQYLTPSVAERLGWTKEEWGSRTFRDQVVPEDRLRLAEAVEGLVRSGARDLSMEFRVRHRDGSIVWVESSGTNLLDDPDVRAIVTNYRNITPRKHAEHARLQAERELTKTLLAADLERRKLEAVLAALPVGVWIANAAGRLSQTNPAAIRIWGGQAPLLQNPREYDFYKAFWPETGKQLLAEEWALSRTFRTGETVVAEAVEIERFDGTRGHVLNSTAPVLGPQGDIVGGVVVMLDVTEAHRAECERDQLIALASVRAKSPGYIAATGTSVHGRGAGPRPHLRARQ